MPLEVGFWRVSGNQVNKIDYSSIDTEKKLEDILNKDISILDDKFMLIGRQVRTSYGKLIDLLAIDQSGKISIIELKKDRTPREVVAQALDYASWVSTLSYKEIAEIYKENTEKEFEEGFEQHFKTPPPEKINEEHDIIIASAALDPETERIVSYLSNNYNVPINVTFYKYFKDGNAEYLSRGWLINPSVVEEKSTKTASQSKGEEWNGRDFVANIDVPSDGVSTWEDSVKYGFISAGGGLWYSSSLKNLFPGARVFAMIPKKGYLGVGRVLEQSTPIKNFMVDSNGKKISIFSVPLKCEGIKKDADDPERCEYLVRIEWIKTLREEEAYWEKGMRANQNSAFKLKNQYTLKKLLEHFHLED